MHLFDISVELNEALGPRFTADEQYLIDACLRGSDPVARVLGSSMAPILIFLAHGAITGSAASLAIGLCISLAAQLWLFAAARERVRRTASILTKYRRALDPADGLTIAPADRDLDLE